MLDESRLSRFATNRTASLLFTAFTKYSPARSCELPRHEQTSRKQTLSERNSISHTTLKKFLFCICTRETRLGRLCSDAGSIGVAYLASSTEMVEAKWLVSRRHGREKIDREKYEREEVFRREISLNGRGIHRVFKKQATEI